MVLSVPATTTFHYWDCRKKFRNGICIIFTLQELIIIIISICQGWKLCQKLIVILMRQNLAVQERGEYC